MVQSFRVLRDGAKLERHRNSIRLSPGAIERAEFPFSTTAKDPRYPPGNMQGVV